MQTVRTVSPVTRGRIEAQGFVGFDAAALAEFGPWLRLAPGLCFAWAAVGTALASPALIWALVPFAALGALRRGHPFDALYNHGIRHLLGTRQLPPYHAPRRFACGVATVWLAVTGWAFFVGATLVGYPLGAAFALAALVPTLTDFCIPSFFYGLLVRRRARVCGVPGERARASALPRSPSTLGLWLLVAVLVAPMVPAPERGAAGGAMEAIGPGARVAAAYADRPLSFERNEGQVDERVRFLARGHGYTVFLTADEAVLALRPAPAPAAAERGESPAGESVLRLQLVGAHADPPVVGQVELPGKAYYLRGNDPARWRSAVPTYARVHYQAVYPGVDLVYYGRQGELEYDFVVAPGADPQAITLAFAGAERLEVAADGALVVQLGERQVRQHPPVVYQGGESGRQAIAGGYVLRGEQAVGFAVGPYDTSRPLVIDPVIVYSTYLGGSASESGNAIAVDRAGNAYVTGYTDSANFPGAGAFDTSLDGDGDAFVARFDARGHAAA